VWVHSNLLALKQGALREENLARAKQDLGRLVRYLKTHRPRAPHRLRARVDRILERRRVARYLVVKVQHKPEHEYRQVKAGRPGPDTRYRRITRRRWEITWSVDEAKVAYDRATDGIYPLLTNDRTLTAAQVLAAHKGQPAIERRFQQMKSVHEIAPVFLKNEGRIEALFFLYAVALLVQGLLERELRAAMKREGVAELPLYPEDRPCRRPTAEQVMRLFAHVARHAVERPDGSRETFEPQLTELQTQILDLLDIPRDRYQRS
jgi:transposase